MSDKTNTRKPSTCPACGSRLNGTTCDVCGWVQFIYPEVVPEEITRFENSRAEAFKAGMEARRQAELRAGRAEQALHDSEATAASLRDEINRLNSDAGRAADRIRRAENEARSLRDEADGLRAEIATLRRQAEEAASAQADAFLIVTNPDGEISALGVGGASSRFVNDATLRADSSARGAGRVDVFTPVKIDFTIEHSAGLFLITDRQDNLLVNGRKPKSRSRILNSAVITFAGIDSLRIVFSIPAKAR